MNAPLDIFNRFRSRPIGIACRMLGSRSDAEDILQGCVTVSSWLTLKAFESAGWV